MHDAKGRPLAVGDHILVPATVTRLGTTDDYCNVDLESVYGRRPDGSKEHISAINTGVLLRCNPDDSVIDPFGYLGAEPVTVTVEPAKVPEPATEPAAA